MFSYSYNLPKIFPCNAASLPLHLPAFYNQAGRKCRHCKRPDPTILATDQLVSNSSSPFHIGCAVKYRKELEDKINVAADAHRKTFSAKRAAKASSKGRARNHALSLIHI